MGETARDKDLSSTFEEKVDLLVFAGAPVVFVVVDFLLPQGQVEPFLGLEFTVGSFALSAAWSAVVSVFKNRFVVWIFLGLAF
jgi:hypothetical protein